MKFVTYAEQNDSIPRFGFKVEKQIELKEEESATEEVVV